MSRLKIFGSMLALPTDKRRQQRHTANFSSSGKPHATGSTKPLNAFSALAVQPMHAAALPVLVRNFMRPRVGQANWARAPSGMAAQRKHRERVLSKLLARCPAVGNPAWHVFAPKDRDDR